MRVSIVLSKEEHGKRERRLATNPDEFIDKEIGDLAELIWDLVPEGTCVEGVDLCDPDGRLLYTVVGDPV